MPVSMTYLGRLAVALTRTGATLAMKEADGNQTLLLAEGHGDAQTPEIHSLQGLGAGTPKDIRDRPW